MITKKDLVTVKITDAADLEELDKKKFRFTAEVVSTSYNEEFTNEDNGEIVTVERNNFLMAKGVELTPDDFSMLLFHFQSGDMKELLLCNQKREGSVVNNSTFGIWVVKAVGSKTKLNMLLRASNAKKAYDIASDYIELYQNGSFSIESIKTFDDCTIIEKVSDENEDPVKKAESVWYNISVVIEEGVGDEKQSIGAFNYIVFADTVETGKSLIEDHIAVQRVKMERRTPFVVKVQEAKVINCNVIVPEEFCYAYRDEQEMPII